MTRQRHTPQEIIGKLVGAETELNQGATIEAVCPKLEISEQAFHPHTSVGLASAYTLVRLSS